MKVDFENKIFLYLPFAGEVRPISENIEPTNHFFGSDLKYIGQVVEDGVAFAVVEIGNSSAEAIFHLGFNCGLSLARLRYNNQTSWIS